jgi:hypothetical protein
MTTNVYVRVASTARDVKLSTPAHKLHAKMEANAIIYPLLFLSAYVLRLISANCVSILTVVLNIRVKMVNVTWILRVSLAVYAGQVFMGIIVNIMTPAYCILVRTTGSVCAIEKIHLRVNVQDITMGKGVNILTTAIAHHVLMAAV